MNYRIANEPKIRARTVRPRRSARDEYLESHRNLQRLGIIPEGERPAPANESKRRIYETNPSALDKEPAEDRGAESIDQPNVLIDTVKSARVARP